MSTSVSLGAVTDHHAGYGARAASATAVSVTGAAERTARTGRAGRGMHSALRERAGGEAHFDGAGLPLTRLPSAVSCATDSGRLSPSREEPSHCWQSPALARHQHGELNRGSFGEPRPPDDGHGSRGSRGPRGPRGGGIAGGRGTAGCWFASIDARVTFVASRSSSASHCHSRSQRTERAPEHTGNPKRDLPA